MTTMRAARPRPHTFDFQIGAWTVRHRRLRRPLSGSADWYEFTGSATAQTLMDGAVSIDQIELPLESATGMSIRLYEPDAGTWTIYWVNSRNGRLQPPVTGVWEDGVFDGTGDDEYDDRAILARYRWSDITDTTATWEQAFSIDGGTTWETNWVMRWTRRDVVTGT